ncbi:Radial spoke head protein 3 [Entophlyctis luteolus]|nr:Radial spoke head protein 3 [Entophlyctis luteolus]KAJ3352132.1 Radial spoke head protein 3 [Entophlyctis luteolus]KAJ3387809.1 Radial spoke head protein 3 [Entophlyctis sp. JEL0112]
MSLFIGRLPSEMKVRDLEDIFQKFGRISRLDVKRGASFNFAFVEFEDKRDAEDALRETDGMDTTDSVKTNSFQTSTPVLSLNGPKADVVKIVGRMNASSVVARVTLRATAEKAAVEDAVHPPEGIPSPQLAFCLSPSFGHLHSLPDS